MTDFRQFKRDLESQAMRVLGEAIDAKVIKMGLRASRMLPERTPKDTGRATANWRVTIGRQSNVSTTQTDLGNERTIARLQDSVRRYRTPVRRTLGVPRFRTLFFSNNARSDTGHPYIRDLEFGLSNQAPFGIIQVVAQQLRSEFRR